MRSLLNDNCRRLLEQLLQSGTFKWHCSVWRHYLATEILFPNPVIKQELSIAAITTELTVSKIIEDLDCKDPEDYWEKRPPFIYLQAQSCHCNHRESLLFRVFPQLLFLFFFHVIVLFWNAVNHAELLWDGMLYKWKKINNLLLFIFLPLYLLF